jgi:DNA repair protein RecO (recombination protein O)
MSAVLRRVDHAPAFVLHQMPWRESGRIFELLTREHGRLSVFAQGVRGPRARLAGHLQPFIPLLVSWTGRGEAPRLVGAERQAADHAADPAVRALPARCVMSAWYLNELIVNLTARHDPQPELFDHYATALRQLCAGAPLERELRLFEKRLLDVLGYGLPGAQAGDAPDPLLLASVPAEALRLLAAEQLDDPAIVEQVRPVLRRALALCLDGRSLRTRAVARSLLNLQRVSR